MLHDAGHGDRKSFDTRCDEVDFYLLSERLIELSLIGISEKFDGMKELTPVVEQGDKCLGASDVYA